MPQRYVFKREQIRSEVFYDYSMTDIVRWFQKGTGKWTGIAALTYGIPVTLIGCIYNGSFGLFFVLYKCL